MNLNPYLDVAPEVAAAVAAGKPVVALESTIISHGMPYPQNVETALKVEQIIRDNGAVPATIAILGGRLKAGLTAEEIEYLGKKGQDVTTAALWTRNMRLTRLLFLLNSPPVFAYNLIAGSYTGAAIEVAAFCSFALAVWRFDLRRPAAGPSSPA